MSWIRWADPPAYAGPPPPAALADAQDVIATHTEPEPDTDRSYVCLITGGRLTCADALTLDEARRHANRIGGRVMQLTEPSAT